MKIRTVHLLVALVLLTLSGIVHGKWTNRWAQGAEVEGKKLLEGLDAPVGDWQPGEFTKIEAAEMAPKTQCQARRFNPLKSGKWVQVSVTTGGAEAVAVHTPDVCYLGAGWRIRGAKTKEVINSADGSEIAFWMADFVKTSSTGNEAIRVRWAWSSEGKWEAPNFPVWWFHGAPILYKVYMVHPLTEEEDLTRDDPYRKFAADLITALNSQIR